MKKESQKRPVKPRARKEARAAVVVMAQAEGEDWDATAALLELAMQSKDQILKGDGAELIDTVMTWCLVESVQSPMPQWLRLALYARFDAYLTYRAKTLDEAFGVSRPKGRHADAARQEQAIASRFFSALFNLASAGIEVDNDAAKEEVGNLFSIGSTTARKYYKNQCALRGVEKLSCLIEEKIAPADLPEYLKEIYEQLKPADSARK